MSELNDVPVACPSCAKPLAVSALGEPNDVTTCPHCGATFTYTEEVHESYAGEPGMNNRMVMKLRLISHGSKTNQKERDQLKWADVALELCQNGLRNRRGLILTGDPITSDVEMWNLHAARLSIQDAIRTDSTTTVPNE